MTAGEQDQAQERLLQLLAERARAGSAPGGHPLDREIEAVAAELGLAPEEVESLTPAVVTATVKAPKLAGRYRIYRRASTVLPFVFGLILAALVAQLGQPVIAAAGVALLVCAWLIRGRATVARFEVDPAGQLTLGRYGPISWYEVDEVTFRYRRPWFSPRDSLESIAGTTAQIRLRRRDGSTVRLARGQLFQTRPQRRPLVLADLATYLRRQARAAGLKVERLDRAGRWRAYRPAQ